MTTTETRPRLELIDVDPHRLITNPANVRSKMHDLDELAASIGKVGVLVPLVVRPDTVDGTFVIVAGHRRAAAAVKASVDTVPAIVQHDAGDESADLTAMLIENLHRENLSATDEAHGFEQLAAFGVTVDEIAQLTGRKTERVQSGLAIAKSRNADKIAKKANLTLEQLAGIVEFEDDQQAVQELVNTAENDPGYFDHELADLRQQREDARKRQESIDKLTTEGVKVLGKRPGYNASHPPVRLDCLVTDAGKNITPSSHKKCPGHAAFVDQKWGSGTPEYACTDPTKHGHKSRYDNGRSTSTSSSPAKAKPTAAEREKAAEEKRQREEQHKALEVATGVRRKFVKTLLARKSPPKGTLAFAVPLLVSDKVYFDDWDPDVVVELTGVRNPQHPFDALAQGATDGRLQVVMVAKIACSIETTIGPELLDPKPYTSTGGVAAYLEYLQACGYTLADVEQKVLALCKAHETRS